MKSFMRNCNVSAIISIVFLGGCATGTITSEEAKRYANSSLEQFLSERFSDKQSVFVGNTIRYTAHFNEVNPRQLDRPTSEVFEYCGATGGSARRTQSFNGNPVGKYFPNPNVAAAQGAAYARYRGHAQLAEAVARTMYEETELANARLDAPAARAAYESMAKQGAYGVWSCKYNGVAGREDWSVSIIPIGYLPRAQTANLLTSHRLTIEIAAIPK